MKQILQPLKNTILHPQWPSFHYHNLSRRSLDNIKNSVVLDIGSGNSNNKILLGENCRLYCLDYLYTNKLYGKEPDIYGDAARLPVDGCMIDTVLLLEVLEHLPDDKQALDEIFRVLKPGGKLFISVPFIYPVHDAPSDYRRYTIFGITELLEKAGFKIIDRFIHGNSFVTFFQVFNLSLLELVRDLYKKNHLLALFLAVIFYPVCLLSNILAYPFIHIKKFHASCLGYFVIAVRA